LRGAFLSFERVSQAQERLVHPFFGVERGLSQRMKILIGVPV
jgi:hypothetical protein